MQSTHHCGVRVLRGAGGCDASGVVLTNVSISESQTFGFDSELRALMFAADAERENRLAA